MDTDPTLLPFTIGLFAITSLFLLFSLTYFFLWFNVLFKWLGFGGRKGSLFTRFGLVEITEAQGDRA